jgi:hypothetical protein
LVSLKEAKFELEDKFNSIIKKTQNKFDAPFEIKDNQKLLRTVCLKTKE